MLLLEGPDGPHILPQRVHKKKTIMELGPRRPSLLWFEGPGSMVVVYMDPLGYHYETRRQDTIPMIRGVDLGQLLFSFIV